MRVYLIASLVLVALGNLAGAVGVVFGLSGAGQPEGAVRRGRGVSCGMAALALGVLAMITFLLPANGYISDATLVVMNPFGAAVLASPIVAGGAAVALARRTLRALMLAVLPIAVSLAILSRYVSP